RIVGILSLEGLDDRLALSLGQAFGCGDHLRFCRVRPFRIAHIVERLLVLRETDHDRNARSLRGRVGSEGMAQDVRAVDRGTEGARPYLARRLKDAGGWKAGEF